MPRLSWWGRIRGKMMSEGDSSLAGAGAGNGGATVNPARLSASLDMNWLTCTSLWQDSNGGLWKVAMFYDVGQEAIVHFRLSPATLSEMSSGTVSVPIGKNPRKGKR